MIWDDFSIWNWSNIGKEPTKDYNLITDIKNPKSSFISGVKVTGIIALAVIAYILLKKR